MIIGENVTFTIEVEDSPKAILLVFDRKCDHAIIPWQDAEELAKVMKQVIKDVKKEFPALEDSTTILREQKQVRIAQKDGLVALKVDWTDRLKFTTVTAFTALQMALSVKAQDGRMAAKGVHFKYNKAGLLSSIFNSKSGSTQVVR